MSTTKASGYILVALYFALARIAGAQTAAPIATQKYLVHRLALPFHARLVGIDDAGVIVGMAMNAGFIYRPGDTAIELWLTPDNTGATVQPLAMNGHGEVIVGFYQNAGEYRPWSAEGFIFSNRDRTFRPFRSTQMTAGCDGPIYSYNNSGQIFCGMSRTQIIVPSLGPAGSFDTPTALPSITPVACPDHSPALALGGNNKGQFVGSCLPNVAISDSNGQRIEQRGFVYDINSGTTNVFDYPGAFKTIANTITDTGVVIGTYRAKGSSGAFSYDGARFTRLEGIDANKPGASVSMDADLFVGNSLGAIIGIDHASQAYIAVLPGQPFPKVAEALDSAHVRGLTYRPGNRQIAGAHTADPNFGLQGGSYNGHGFQLNWSNNSSDGAPRIDGTESGYLGFNEQGSWFTEDGILYRWNTQSKTLTCVLEGAPANLHKPALTDAEYLGAVSNAKPIQPTRGSQGKVTKFADGNLYLSYYVDPGNGSSIGMVLKVVRPVNDTPAAMPVAKAGPGNTGSWVYIGEGAQAAVAALMNLDASGTVAWNFMAPASAQKYLAR